MSEREGSQRSRGAPRAGRPALAPGDLSEKRAQRAGLTPDRVVAEAAALADERGIRALSLVPLAERLGVKVPSLYKHVGGLDDLHRRLALAATTDLAQRLGAATVGRSGRDALQACATAWRDYAKDHPGQYAAIARGPDRADPDAVLIAAADRILHLVFAILRGYDLDEDGTVHAARAVRSALHGFVTLEAEHGFGLSQDLDVSFDRMITLLDAGLSRRS